MIQEMIASFLHSIQRPGLFLAGTGCVLLLFSDLTATAAIAQRSTPEPQVREQVVPILATRLNSRWEVIGVVAYVHIHLQEHEHQGGLQLRFRTEPGRFSSGTQQAVVEAICYAAQAARLRAGSWTVTLTVPHPGVTVYGDSLSAMVGLSVVALAKGDPLYPDRAITGTLTAEGQIGIVGGVPYKIDAAHARHMQRVIIPAAQHMEDGDWRTPFLMEVSPVGTLRKAYYGLTDRPL